MAEIPEDIAAAPAATADESIGFAGMRPGAANAVVDQNAENPGDSPASIVTDNADVNDCPTGGETTVAPESFDRPSLAYDV